MSKSRDIADSAATINYIDGLTSDAQTQLDGKATYPTQTGNSGKFLTTDGTNTSWAAVSAGKISRTATGAITAGQPVVINSDGTVSPVAGLDQAESIGSEADWETVNALSSWFSTAYNTTANKGVINFRYNSNAYLYSRVITNSSGTLSFGTITTTASFSSTSSVCVYNANQDVFVFLYYDNGTGQLKLRAAEIVGTVLSYGSEIVVRTSSRPNSALATTNGAEVLICESDRGTLRAVTATCSGTTLTLNTEVTLTASGSYDDCALGQNTTDGNTFALAFEQNTNAAICKVTVTGTVPSFGTPQEISSGISLRYTNVIWNAEYGRWLYVFVDESGTTKTPVYKILSESGGTFTVLDTASPELTSVSNSMWPQLAYDSTNYFVLASSYVSSTNNNTAYAVLMVDDALSFGAGTDIASSGASDRRMVQYYDPDGEAFVVSYLADDADGSSIVLTPQASYTNRDAYFGIADSNISDGASGDITIVSGLNASVSGLTAGDFYYLAPTGALTATSNGYPVGHALSATSIILDNVGYNAIPAQTGNSGKYLTTDGSNSSWASIARLGATTKWSWIQTSFHDGGLTMAIPQSGVLTGDWFRSTYGGVGVTDHVVYPIYSISYSEYHGAWFGIANREGQGTSSNWDIVRSYDGINWLTYIKNLNNNINGGQFNPYSNTSIDSVLAVDDQTGWLWFVNGNQSSPYQAYAHYWRPGVDNGNSTWNRVDVSSSGSTQYKSSWIKYVNHPTNPGLCYGYMNVNNNFYMSVKSAGTTTTWALAAVQSGLDGSDSNVCHFMWNPDDGVAFISGFKNRQNGLRSTDPVSGSWSATGSINNSASDKSNVCVGNGFLIVTFDSTYIRYSTDDGVSFQQQSGFNTAIRRVYFDGTNFLYAGDSESYTNTDPSKTPEKVPIVYDGRDFGKPQFRGV